MLLTLPLFALVACAPGVDTGKGGSAEGCAERTWYTDADGDGYGDVAVPIVSCDVPAGAVTDASDCDDTSADVHPGVEDACDGVDTDCDRDLDEDATWFAATPDADGDGYGDAAGVTSVCALPAGWTTDASDCGDADPDVFPGATEHCDGVDEDCDGETDEDAVDRVVYHPDSDGDGYGNPDDVGLGCAPGDGLVDDDEDCDDTSAAVHPGAEELCLDAIDEDCDGLADDYSQDCWPLDPGPTGACGDVEPVEGCEDGIAAVSEDGTTWPDLQSALDAAVTDEVITVCPGSWTGPFEASQPITLVGFGPGVTELTATVAPIYWAPGPPSASVAFVNLSFYASEISVSGMDWLCADTVAMAQVSSSSFERPPTEAEFTNVLVWDNTDGSLAGSPNSAAPVRIDRSLFLDNASSEPLVSADGSGELTITDTTFSENSAPSVDAVLRLRGSATVTLDTVTFEGNDADVQALIWAEMLWGSLDCSACVFTGNVFQWGDGGAVELRGTGTVRFTDSTFTNNQTYIGSGGAVSIDAYDDSEVRFTNCTFSGNSAKKDAGAISVNDLATGTYTIDGGTFDTNSATSGGAIRPGAASTLIVTGASFSSNSPDDTPGLTWGADASFTCADGVCE